MSQVVTIENNSPDEERKENLVDDMDKCVISNCLIQNMMNKESFYSYSKSYWQEQPSTVDGMLGGFGNLTFADLANSAEFLAKLTKNSDTTLAIDCGAGIGRITKGLLLNIYDKVEMVDTCQEHLDHAKEYMGEKLFSRVSAQHCCGLEDFHPEANKYDLVWIQWVTMYISDKDLIEVLQRFQKSLRPDGFIVIKDNVCERRECAVDNEDGSVTRSVRIFEEIFRKAGVTIVQSKREKGFPKDLYPLQYYVLQ